MSEPSPGIRIALADDHAVVREGLRVLLERVDDFDVVGEAQDGQEVLQLVRDTEPDVAVIDLAMPKLNGVEATRRIAKEMPGVRVVMLSMYTGDEYVLQALGAGAAGYVVKDSAADNLVTAIRTVARGQQYLSPGIPQALLEDARQGISGNPLDRLTSREREVLQLIAEGNSNKEIASLLDLSVKTVEAHRGNLMAKLDIHDTASLTRFAIAHGLVEP